MRVSAIVIGLVLLCPLAVGSEVTVVGDQCVLVDGKPFFPIGLYSAGGAIDFPYLAEAGFNTVHSYAWEGMSTHDGGQAWLDAACDNGLMALIGLYRPHVKAMEFEGAIRRIEQFRDHPALLAWHTMDEPSWDREGDMGKDYMPRAYEIVKQHDPRHPVTAVTCHFGDCELFEPSVDAMQADYYAVPPIPANWYSGTGFRGVKLFVDKWREASGGRKPFWFVAQAFDFSTSKEKGYDVPEEWRRGPTYEEMRCQTYTAVAAGARGILYWSLSRLLGDQMTRGLMPRVRLWEDLKSVVGELNALMPLLTADTEETRAEANGVASMVKSDGNDLYIVAVNYERRRTEAAIEIPGVRGGTAEGVFGKGSLRIRNGKLSLRFAPLEAKVLRVRPRR